MSRAFLVWLEGDGFRTAEITEHGETVLGRAIDAAVVLQDQTVSRRHAVISASDGRFAIEHLSRTNPTRVSGATISARTPLADGDHLVVGSTELLFCDLAEADVARGPRCSFCGRENSTSEKDCWYCGTSLVNAATFIAETRRVMCRAVSSRLTTADVYASGEAVSTPDLGSRGSSASDPRAYIQERDGLPILSPPDGPDSARSLRTGDTIAVAGERYVVLVR